MIAASPLPVFAGCGLELEYMIVDRRSLSILPIADDVLRELAGVYAGSVRCDDMTWSNELPLHVVELCNSEPSADLYVLSRRFAEEVRSMNERLAAFRARLMPTAMHPWMDPASETHVWTRDRAAIYRAYERIFGCRTHGEVNLQSMQINLPFADDAEFARLHAAIRLLLPILPALAASSPIADGVPQGFLDFRMEAYRYQSPGLPELVGSVVPDTVASRAEYQARVLDPMYRAIAPRDAQGVLRHEWLNARGAIARFDRGAIEIRVIDAQECPRADLAIARLAIAVVKSLYQERWSALEVQQTMRTEALAAILLDCTHDAERAMIDDLDYLGLLGLGEHECSAGTLWLRLIEAHPDAVCGDELETYLRHGSLARRILRAVGPGCGRARLHAVYRDLCDCLAENRLFV